MDEDTQQQVPAEPSLDQLQIDLEEAIKQSQANLDGWKRATADFDNYRRRKEAENKELVEFAREVAVAKLLPTLDSLEQALRHMPEYKSEIKEGTEAGNDGVNFSGQYQNWQQGVGSIITQLDKTLAELGVKKIEAVGKKFDPHFHEAVREIDSESDDGTVLEEFQSGFELNGKVIRPSQVAISKKKVS